MFQPAAKTPGFISLLLPSILLAGFLGVVALQADLIRLPGVADPGLAPQTVTLAPRAYTYRAAGSFQRGGAGVDGPLISIDPSPPLEIMKFQVSAADYARCVAEGVCEKADPRWRGKGNVPVTGVSFNDATRYAAWLTARTGQTWRLPTVAEWQMAAGSKAGDDALGIGEDQANPSVRWLAAYAKQAEIATGAPTTPKPLGSGGVNEFGIADLSGPVWEWTSTCDSRTTLDAEGAVRSHVDSCGVRYLEGRHRTAMSAFVRDAQGGGCSTGAPPDNLGFRLVRDRE